MSNPYETPQNAGLLEKTAAEKAMDDFNEEKEKLNKIDIAVQLEGGVSKKYLAELERDLTQKKLNVHKVDARLKEFKAKVAKVQKLVAEKNASSGEGGTEAQDDTPVSSLSASPGVDKATIEPKPRAGRKPEPSTPDERLANHQERARVALDDSEHELEDIKNLLWPHLTDEVVDKNAELQKIKKQLADDFLAQLSSLRDKVATILQNNETSEAKADALKELNNGEIMQFHHDKVQSVLTRAKRVAEGVGLTDLVAVIDKEQRGSGDNLELLEEIGRRGMKNIRISDGHRRAGVPIPEASSTPAPPESQSGAPQAQPKPAPSSVSSSASSTPPSPKLGSVVGGASAPKPAPPSSQTPQSPPIPVQGGYKEGAGPTFKKPEATPPLVPPSSPDEWAGYMGGIPKGVNPVAAWQAWKKENGSTPPPTAEPGEKNEAEDIMNPEFWNSAKFDLQVNREGLEKTLADNNISSTELPSWVDYERVYISELDSVNEAINAVGIGDTHRVQQLKDTLMEQNIALHSVIDKLEKEINYVVDGREKLKAGVNDTIVPSASSGGGGEGVADLTPRPNERTLDTFVIEAVGRPWPEVLEEFKDALARVKEKAVELGQGENVAIERSVKSAEDYIDGKTDFTGVFKNSELPVFSRRLGALNATLQLLDSIEKRGAGQAVVDTPTPVEVTPIDTGESLDRYDIKQFEGKTWADVILVWTTLRDEVLERANGLEGASTDEFISKALRNAQKTLDEHKIENDAELAKARVTRGELDTLGNRLIGLRECMTKMDRMEAERAAGPDGATEVTPVDGPEGEEVPERFVIKEIDTKNPEQLADELRACAERVKDAAKEKYGETPYPREVQDAIDQAQAHANSIQGISTDTLTERAQVRYRQYVEKLEGALGIIAQHTQVPGDADAPSAPGETQEHVPSSLSPENLQSLNTMREEVESKLAELEANGNITSDAKNPLKKNVKMWQEAGLWTKGDKERPDDPIGSARTISDILIQTADRLLEEGDTSAEGTVAIGDTPQEGGGEGSAIEELVAELNDLKGRRGNWKNTDGRGVRDKYTNDMRDLNPDELNAQEKSRNRLNRRIAELEAEIARRRGETVEDVHPGEEDTVSAPTEPIATTPEVVDPTQSSSTELFSAPSSETDAFKEGRERVATAREAYFEELRKYELGKSNVVWREFKRILPFTKVEGEPQALVDAGREYAESRAALMKEQNDERRQKLTARLTERFSEKNRGLQSLFLRDAGMDVGEASKLSQEDARVKYAELIQNRVEKWNWGKTYHDNVVGEFRQRNQILDQAREERASGAQKAAMQSFARAFQALPGWIKSTKVRRTVGITLAAGTGVAGATAALGTAPIWVAAGATAGVGFYGGSMLAGIGAHLGVGKYFEKYVKQGGRGMKQEIGSVFRQSKLLGASSY
jgi:hypothetical protein